MAKMQSLQPFISDYQHKSSAQPGQWIARDLRRLTTQDGNVYTARNDPAAD